MYNIGSVCAVFFTGPTNDYLGRRAGMFIGSFLIIIGTCIQAPSTTHGMFLGGRFVLGFGVSFCCVLVCTIAPGKLNNYIPDCPWILLLNTKNRYIGSIIASWVVYGCSYLSIAGA